MEEEDSTEFADDLLAKAKAMIKAGNGQVAFFTSGNANGKSFTLIKELSALDVAMGCRSALDLYRGKVGAAAVTFLDFSRL